MIHSHQTIWLKNIFLEYLYITSYSPGAAQTYHTGQNDKTELQNELMKQ